MTSWYIIYLGLGKDDLLPCNETDNISGNLVQYIFRLGRDDLLTCLNTDNLSDILVQYISRPGEG